jgi:peroxiredoxin
MLLESRKGNLNSEIVDFHLMGIDDKIYSPGDFAGAKILVIVFMCNHCPYVKAVIGRLVKLQDEFSGMGVRFIGINPNDEKTYPEDSLENMKHYYIKWKMNFPYLRDDTQETAKSFDAICTPDIYVYDENRILKYRGRIDDNWKDENSVSKRELADALTCLLEGRQVSENQNPSIGCSIKWK